MYILKTLKAALIAVKKGKSIGEISEKLQIPRVTLGDEYNKFCASDYETIEDYLAQPSSHPILLKLEEEAAVEKYALWQHERGNAIGPEASQSVDSGNSFNCC